MMTVPMQQGADARNTGHGHVRPRPDGVKNRCGGPRLCRVCALEYAALPATDSPPLAPAAPESPWLQTLPVLGSKVGGYLDLVNPTADMIDWDTVATVSARIPRFAGHTGMGVLSVAQHELEGAHAIIRDTGNRRAAAAFLIHDAHETYMGDIATPVAKALARLADCITYDGGRVVRKSISTLKSALDSAIYSAAGFNWPLDPATVAIVKEYDTRMCRTEQDARMATAPRPWEKVYTDAVPVEGVDLYPWSEGTTRAIYRCALRELLPCFQSC